MQIKKEHVKELLVQSATKEFIKYGFNNSSLRRIVKAVDLSTGTFYTYFKDKEDIFAYIVSPWTDTLQNLIKYSPEEPFLVKFHNTENPQIIYEAYNNVLKLIFENKIAAYIYLHCAEGSKFQNLPLQDIEKQVEKVYEVFSRDVFIFSNETYIDKFFLTNFYIYFLNFLKNVLKNNIPFEDANKKLQHMTIFASEGWIGLKESQKAMK